MDVSARVSRDFGRLDHDAIIAGYIECRFYGNM